MFYGTNKHKGDIRRDVDVLKEDVARAAADAKEEVLSVAQEALGRAQEKIAEVTRTGRVAGQRMDRYTKEHTWTAVAVAAAVGVVVGLLMGRDRR